jgi:hypothetical protein
MQDSHRAECAGILGALYTLDKLIRSWNIESGSFCFACDNLSALRYSFDRQQYYPEINGNYPDFDLLHYIRSLIGINYPISWHHVKGHQDRQISALTFPEHLNVLADVVTNARRQQIRACLPTYSLPNDQWSITIGTGRVGQHLETTLYSSYSKERMRKFWKKKEME